MGPGLREQVSQEAGVEAATSLRPRPRKWHVIAGHVPPVRQAAHPWLSRGDTEGSSHRDACQIVLGFLSRSATVSDTASSLGVCPCYNTSDDSCCWERCCPPTLLKGTRCLVQPLLRLLRTGGDGKQFLTDLSCKFRTRRVPGAAVAGHWASPAYLSQGPRETVVSVILVFQREKPRHRHEGGVPTASRSADDLTHVPDSSLRDPAGEEGAVLGAGPGSGQWQHSALPSVPFAGFLLCKVKGGGRPILELACPVRRHGNAETPTVPRVRRPLD